MLALGNLHQNIGRFLLRPGCRTFLERREVAQNMGGIVRLAAHIQTSVPIIHPRRWFYGKIPKFSATKDEAYIFS